MSYAPGPGVKEGEASEKRPFMVTPGLPGSFTSYAPGPGTSRCGDGSTIRPLMVMAGPRMGSGTSYAPGPGFSRRRQVWAREGGGRSGRAEWEGEAAGGGTGWPWPCLAKRRRLPSEPTQPLQATSGTACAASRREERRMTETFAAALHAKSDPHRPAGPRNPPLQPPMALADAFGALREVTRHRATAEKSPS